MKQPRPRATPLAGKPLSGGATSLRAGRSRVGSRRVGWSRSLAVATAGWVALAGAFSAAAESVPDDQSQLEPVVNAGGRELRFNWPLLKIGTAEYREGPTGVTVFRFGRKMRAAFDVRGEPVTANTELLRLGRDKPSVDAVVFAGGSAYGIECTTAVATAMKDDQLRSGTWNDVAHVTGAIIYDLGDRRLNEIYPDKRLAQAAFRGATDSVFRIGSAGAGRCARTGYFFGANACSGQGGAYYERGDLKIAAFTVVNALGLVTDRQGRIQAGYPGINWPANPSTPAMLQAMREQWTDGPVEGKPTQNTTISLIVVNQNLSFGDLQRLAIQVHTSMSRGLQPYATEWDGDVLFAVATGEVDLPPTEPARTTKVALIPAIAAEVMWDAILSSVPEQPVQPPPVTVSTPLPGTYAGRYRFSRFVTVEVTAREGRLFAQATGERPAYEIGREKPVELVPTTPDLTRFTLATPHRYPLTLDFSHGALVINPGPWEQKGTRQ